jgi:hydrogenase-4 component F
MWKYLLMCSVGVAFAFTGTILVAASTAKAHMTGADLLHWTRLMESAGGLDQSLLKMGFIFLVVGFGTKAGLAPMHNWLPDAHSQAPAPVSAIFSGFLLNAALYCILRYIPILDLATGNSIWAHDILIVFGVASILIAAAFIVAQHDVKRLLAYHSVEHLGIIAFGAGVGGLGAFAALFHILNHSLCKALSFFCAGTLGQIYGTHDMRKMTGVVRKAPVWGVGLLVSLLALIGVAPFALFLSEFLILKAAWNAAAYWTMSFFIVGLGVVFVGALRHVIPMAWEAPPDGIPETRASGIGVLVVAAPICVLLVLGLWMPELLKNVLTQAISVLGEKI